MLPALLLVSISLWEVCSTRHAADATPDDAAWNRASEIVRAGYRPGDLIVFAPDWVDPVGRLHLGDLIPIDMAARMDAARYGRIWELAIRGAHAPEVAGLEPVSSNDADGVAVRRYERAPVTVLADVRDLVSTAKTESAGQSGPTLELAEVGFAPHRCIQVIPQAGKPVRITFPQLALGSQLVGYVGLADVFKRRDIRAPGKLEVELDHNVIASAEPGVDDGWVRFEATTTPGAADLTFIISATAADRLICFAAEARK
ncbi:MAG: hypothetical protein JWO36_738 [Myxococcales bacterium]|nr:hypothetical protein [Myxococcales bacterium]